jgi:hypothetical protein
MRMTHPSMGEYMKCRGGWHPPLSFSRGRVPRAPTFDIVRNPSGRMSGRMASALFVFMRARRTRPIQFQEGACHAWADAIRPYNRRIFIFLYFTTSP